MSGCQTCGGFGGHHDPIAHGEPQDPAEECCPLCGRTWRFCSCCDACGTTYADCSCGEEDA